MKIVPDNFATVTPGLTVGRPAGWRIGLGAVLILALVWGGLIGGLSSAWGKTGKKSTEIVRVLGKGKKSDADPAAARETAITSGLNEAVIQVAQTIVPPELLISHFKALVALLDQRTESFVQRYKVLAEHNTEKEYQVLIEAVVLRDRIKEAVDEAGLMVENVPLPAILFLVSEQSIGESTPRFWWHADGEGQEIPAEKALAGALGARGYGVVDHSTPLPEGSDRMELSGVEVVRIGRYYKADLVIAGKATARLAKNTRVTDLKTYEGAMTVRAYRVDSGAQIAISHAQAVAVNTDDIAGGKSVFQLVANIVADDVAQQLSAHRRHPGASALSPIVVDVSGTNHLRSFVALRKALNTMAGVERMQIEALIPPRATLRVHFHGSAGKLARNLKKIRSTMLRLQVEPSGADHVNVILLP